MRCIVSCCRTSFSWLIFFFAALLWGSIIYKHTGRWMWQGSASVISLNWEKCPCHSKLISTLSMLLSSVLSWSLVGSILCGQVNFFFYFFNLPSDTPISITYAFYVCQILLSACKSEELRWFICLSYWLHELCEAFLWYWCEERCLCLFCSYVAIVCIL